ncbi:hypothetical protein BDV29DRAFT_165687 [Aspergillus leporis]|uniref:Uncharacterized protein n=1 Tax=Aspergillus leporis TaxID=41062 RepID=A0A5N5XD93_9EURO|nr:hypothetical protein BDV29DRAFT_165687 [Aspergillus leporis]
MVFAYPWLPSYLDRLYDFLRLQESTWGFTIYRTTYTQQSDAANFTVNFQNCKRATRTKRTRPSSMNCGPATIHALLKMPNSMAPR